MDKIKFEGDIWAEAHWSTDDMAGKINELVEGYNEIKAKMSYYNELDRRLKRLEKIEVKRMLDNQ